MMSEMNILRVILIIIAFNLLAISGQFVNHKNCGRIVKKFVVGGIDAEEHEFPFMVSLQTKSKRGHWQHFCGGSVLNENWVLTAAHCANLYQMKGMRFRLLVGTNNKEKASKELNQIYKVEKVVINGCFSMAGLDSDIALVKTTKPFDFNNNTVSPICLPPKGKEPISKKIQIAGWGVWTETSSGEAEDSPKILQKIETEIKSEWFCRHYTYFRLLGTLEIRTYGQRICVFSQENTICRGDSGGPAFHSVNGRYYQIGIASFIAMSPQFPFPFPTNKCLKSNPAFYAKTSHFIDWISRAINDNSSEKVIKTKCN